MNTTTSAHSGTVAPLSNHSGPHLRRKLVVVGAGATGKTCLLMVHCRDFFPSEYVPTVFENYIKEMVHEKKIVDLSLWDTAGQEDYDRLRPLSYPDSDVVLMCYAINDRRSFEEIRSKWNPEVEHFCEGVPKILVALKSDLRSVMAATPEERARYVTVEEGQALADTIGATAFIECSSRTKDNVGLVFQKALDSIFENERRIKKMRRAQKINRLMGRCCIQ